MNYDDEFVNASFGSRVLRSMERVSKSYLRKTAKYIKFRWLLTILLLVVFCLRIAIAEGWYLVAYMLGIHLLGNFVNFLSPIEDEETGVPILPVHDNSEFRPMERKLPEFKFWKQSTFAILLALIASLINAFNIPVVVGILVAYFVFVVLLMAYSRYTHMKEHNYNPFADFTNKPSYRPVPTQIGR